MKPKKLNLKMTKLNQKQQYDNESHIFKCWCGEHSYLEVSKFDEDTGDIEIYLTQHPSSLFERLRLAFMSLRGLEITTSSSVIIAEEDVKELIKALKQK